jgi:hypothetical protein
LVGHRSWNWLFRVAARKWKEKAQEEVICALCHSTSSSNISCTLIILYISILS